MANEIWVSVVSGDWSNAADWGGTVPYADTANATIAAVGHYTVTISHAITVNSVLLDQAGAILKIDGQLDLAGTADQPTQNAGTLEIDGVVANGTIDATAGQVEFEANAELKNIDYIGNFTLSTSDDVYVSNLQVRSGSTLPWPDRAGRSG